MNGIIGRGESKRTVERDEMRGEREGTEVRKKEGSGERREKREEYRENR